MSRPAEPVQKTGAVKQTGWRRSITSRPNLPNTLRSYAERIKPNNRREAIRLVLICLPILALAGGWTYLAYQHPLDRHDPLAVSRQFVLDMQQNKPFSAYRLTSPTYQESVKIKDFSETVLPALQEQMPFSKPELFAKAVPPDRQDKMEVVFNIPGDSTNGDYRTAVLVVQKNGLWAVEAINGAPGKATRENVRQSPSKPPAGNQKQ